MSETETWKQHKREQQIRRAERLPERTDAILHLKVAGYDVEQKTEFHFRINGAIDLYPIHNRWHDLRSNKRGGAQDLATWLKGHLRPNETRNC